MKHSTWLRVLAIACLLTGASNMTARPASAAEEARRFLEGLRGRGYHDTAEEYLRLIESSPRCPADFKEVIDYELGATLAAGARSLESTDQQEEQLERATQRFTKFLKDRPDHAMADDARAQLAHLLVERGRIKTIVAKRPATSASQKNRLMTEARSQFEEAQGVFTEAEKRIYDTAKRLQGILDPNRDADKIEERDRARSNLVETRLLLANVTYEIARTFESDAKKYRAEMQKAADKYHELYEKYGSLVGGLYARLWEGRTYKELGDAEKAIHIFLELETLPDQPETYRRLKSQALALTLETHLLPSAEGYAEAARKADAWLADATAAEKSSADGLRVQFLAGQAQLTRYKAMKPKAPGRRDVLNAARKHLQFVSKFPGQDRSQAGRLLASPPLSNAPTETVELPKTYQEAKDAGDFAWGNLVVAMGTLRQAKNRAEQDKLNDAITQARGKTTQYYRAALGFATQETDAGELNNMRFRLAYLYFVDGNFYSAAVTGEFLARRYPQSFGARKGAEIAIKSYRSLFTQARQAGQDGQFEMGRMNRMANYITGRWPGEPEADEAWMMLILTAVDSSDLEKTLEYLDELAPESPRRGQAELHAGLMLWKAYVDGSRLPEEERPPAAELDATVAQARKLLEQGIERLRKAVDTGTAPDYTLVYSTLVLAQIHINAAEPSEAVRWLEDPKIGPITLAAANSPLVKDKGSFAADAYKAALRAYVGVQQLDKAEKAMDALEKQMGGGAELTKIYIQLGRSLQQQLERLRNENKRDEAVAVSKGFEVFLDRISQRKEGNDFSSLNWVAETFFGLGSGLDPQRGEAPTEAKAYYKRAIETYVKIIKNCQTDAAYAPAGATITVTARLAACLRALGQHETALKLLVDILKKNEKRVDVQIEAARTYQDWAKLPGMTDHYNRAIQGGVEQDGRYLVWGWGLIARRVASFDKYQSIFHEARFNLALCRAEMALKLEEPKQTETLKMAKLDIVRIQQLYPELGGEVWKPKYEALLKTIQKRLEKE